MAGEVARRGEASVRLKEAVASGYLAWHDWRSFSSSHYNFCLPLPKHFTAQETADTPATAAASVPLEGEGICIVAEGFEG